jgi:hypothetical protein
LSSIVSGAERTKEEALAKWVRGYQGFPTFHFSPTCPT